MSVLMIRRRFFLAACMLLYLARSAHVISTTDKFADVILLQWLVQIA